MTDQTVMANVIRHYRATVPAPPATLADELREADWNGLGDQIMAGRFADRVEDVEEELSTTYLENERLCSESEEKAAWFRSVRDERDEAQHELDETRADLRDVTNLLDQARAEVERLTVSLNRQCTTVTPSVHNTDALPDPADVPTGEPWFVRDDWGLCIGSRRDEGFQSWTLVRVRTGGLRFRADPDVTLIRPVDISDINPEETA